MCVTSDNYCVYRSANGWIKESKTISEELPAIERTEITESPLDSDLKNSVSRHLT
ncbi:hypothetical protein ACLOJK_034582 [Asimina triloba]